MDTKSPQHHAARPRRLLRSGAALCLKVALFAVVLFYVAKALIRGFQSLPAEQIQLQNAPIVAAALLIGATATLGGAVFWLLISGYCNAPSLPATIAAMWISPLGKYIPGKVANLLGAAWLLQRLGVPIPVAAAVTFTATGLSVTIGLLVGLPACIDRLNLGGGVWALYIAVLAAGCCLLHPVVLARTTNFLCRRMGRNLTVQPVALSRYLLPAGLVLLNQALAGCALWILAASLADVPAGYVGLFISASALAANIGYLAIFAPAGLGVREGILLLILQPLIGTGPTALLVVAFRLLYTIVEVVLALAGIVIFRRYRNRQCRNERNTTAAPADTAT